MPNLAFTWTRITDPLLDDGAITDLVAAPVLGGPGAIVAFKQNKQGRVGWLYGNQFKVLDLDVYELDLFQDAAIAAYLGMDGKLYVILSHAFEDVGASSRLTIGVADAPWASVAYGLLDHYIDARATAVVQAALAGIPGSTDDQETIAALQATVGELEGRLNALQAALDGLRQRVGQAGAALVG